MQLKQDLHMHTIYSTGDGAIVPQQTIELIAAIGHAEVIGISDHFDYLTGPVFSTYEKNVRKFGFKLGTEVNGHDWVDEALQYPFDYYVYHCYNTSADYKGAEKLLATGKPLIIAHPQALDTDLKKVSPQALIEINNRYIFRYDWRSYYTPFLNQFRFILSSDAHQPHWLSHVVAAYVAKELGVENTIIQFENNSI
jgi:histidinol phosphatase-like PHP family hydrolase